VEERTNQVFSLSQIYFLQFTQKNVLVCQVWIKYEITHLVWAGELVGPGIETLCKQDFQHLSRPAIAGIKEAEGVWEYGF